ncbi:MAG TPA: CRISPR-associated protein Cas4 [Ktedonobacteraceae bacterium]|nr:CRISPR-associated protein Cas4 [Ktedonobacteraceae bacterium]
MSDEIELDMLSISYLSTLEYCSRCFYYECALGEFMENAHVVEGKMRHRMSDSGHTTSEDGVTMLRRVWVWSDRLRLSGFADVVEEQDGRFKPIEYKKGKWGQWLNNHVQLCAQALCLEEMLATRIPCGSIFYFGSAHREEVMFTEELRQHTEETVQLAFTLLERGELPPPLVGKQATATSLPDLHPKCRECSLEPLCLPREVLAMRKIGTM